MEFADDIALGNFTSVEFESLVEEDDSPGRANSTAQTLSGFQLSFVISAIIHLALATTLFSFIANDIETIDELVPALIRVDFVPSNPLLNQAEEITPEAPSENTAPIPLVETEQALPVAEPQPAPIESSESEIAEATPAENSNANSQQQLEMVTLPSVESVQRILSNLQRSDASRFYTYDCNKLDEENKLNSCAPSDARDYSPLTRNPIYDFHNPAIEITRSRETVTTLARQSAQISEQLTSGNVPGGFSAYVLEELEQSIETYSNNSVRALDHMNTMVDKSAAGAMARRLKDNWVQQQSILLKSRRVENRSDRLFREKCSGYEKYIMVPTELARCLSIGESPLGFIIEF